MTTGKREKDLILLDCNNDADNNMQGSVSELQERMNTILSHEQLKCYDF